MINGDLVKQIEEYCKLNNIPNTYTYINQLLRDGFNVAKYGSGPFTSQPKERIVEKEVIKEVKVEVPVEVPVEVEKIVEKEKIVHITDDTKVGELLDNIKKLENEKLQEHNVSELQIKELREEINQLKEEFAGKEGEYNERIKQLEEDKVLLTKENQELRIVKPESKKDIYGDNDGGYTFGSNLMDSK